MLRNKSKVVVVILMFVAALFGCQCGGPAVKGPGGQQGGNFPAVEEGDPAEKAAVDAVNKFGHVKQEGGKVVEVAIYKPGFTDADIKLLAAFPKVHKIQISSVNISGVGIKELAGLTDLTYLDIGQNPISEPALKEVATLTQLKYLRIAGAKAGDKALRELAPLTQLEELVISGSGFGDSACVNIASSLPQLTSLHIDNNQIGDVGIMAIAGMPNLKVLYMYGTRHTDLALAALPKLAKLEELHVGATVTDKGMKSIAKCTNLRVLTTFNSKTTDVGLRELNNMPKLEKLEINNGVFGTITNAAIAEFIKTHPNCTVKGP